MGYHLGKTMAQEAAEEGHNNPAYLLNSSLPQRPLIIGQLAKPTSYGGRPLGPHSYDVPSLPLVTEPERPTASFASKTVLAAEKPPITADIDFLNKPELIDVQRQVAPGFHSYTWGKMAQRPNDPSDAKLDKFYDVDNKLVHCPARTSPHPRQPATSRDRRGQPARPGHGVTHRTSAHSAARAMRRTHATQEAPPPRPPPPGAEPRGCCWLSGAQTQLNLSTVMMHHPRKYAASFLSQDRRFKPPKEARPHRTAPHRTAPHRTAPRRAAPRHTAATPRHAAPPSPPQIHGLAPGSYDPPPGCVQIKDANRTTYQFKSTADYSTFGSKAPNEPPDMIHSPLMAMQAATWTSKGFPFSTRERFPRVRSKWKD